MLEATADIPARSATATAPVVPRRPARVAHPAPTLPRVEWRARPVTVANLFSDLFDHDEAAPAAPLTARDRGRARMQALALAREVAAAPELHNLWHDAFDDASQVASPIAAANDSLPPDGVEALCRIRAALYTIDPAETAHAARTASRKDQSIQMRLAVQAMNGTLIVVAAPVGAAVLTYSLFRGEDLRLTGNALAVCGSLMALIQTGLHFV